VKHNIAVTTGAPSGIGAATARHLSIAYAIEQPDAVDINLIVIRPKDLK
jgi:NADP-dependent 3-hydroxy acid dehydrogenase YdfG